MQQAARLTLSAARRGAASRAASGGGIGSLCSDYTFTRIFGTPGASEPILKDMLEAWGEARTPGGGGGGGGVLIDTMEIVNPQVLEGAPPRSKGELIVDVRAKDSGSNFLIEVQHRVEPLFPHRAILYAAADIVSQHVEDVTSSRLRPVHSLAFCDYDFARGQLGTGLGSSLNAWRKSRSHAPDAARVLHTFDLQPRADDMKQLGQTINTALAAEMAARMSFVFVLLPHAPRLGDLTARTPRILQWASLIAHLRADNVDAVPAEVRRAGVDLLLGKLRDSVDETELEALRTARDLDVQDQAVVCALAEGKAEGKAEGMAEALRLLGIETVEAYRARFGADPPPLLAPFLAP